MTTTLNTTTAERALATVRALKPGPDRTGQVQMIREVSRILDADPDVDETAATIIQAPTGSGKSLGLLTPVAALTRIPDLWDSSAEDDDDDPQGDGRAVYLTHSKSLQDQLARDLPAIEAATGLRWAVLKGRSAYACLDRIGEAMGEGKLAGTYDEPSAELRRVAAWAATEGCDGDVDAAGMTLSDDTRKAIFVSSSECSGKRCPKYRECFGVLAHTRAKEANVIVANMALFAADIAAGGHVLPPYRIALVDEAHRLRDALAQGLGVEVSKWDLIKVRNQAGKFVTGIKLSELRAAIEDFETFVDGLSRQERSVRISMPMGDHAAGVINRTASACKGIADAIAALCERADDGSPRFTSSAMRRAHKLATALGEALVAMHRFECVYADGDSVLKSAELDVATILRYQVWPGRRVVCTSATIPTTLAGDLGLDVPVMRLPSPFNYEVNSRIYYGGKHAGDPRDDGWTERFYSDLAELMTAAGGRTLGLFTSFKDMKAAADEMSLRTGLTVLHEKMGVPKAALVERFRSEDDVCLFGSQGFYEGLDVQGGTCSLVVVNKIPFPHFLDPLVQARCERLEAAGVSYVFGRVQVPHARMLMAQAAGRLIRSVSDRGVVAIFDGRINRKNYGKEVVADLTALGMPVTQDLDAACDWLSEITTTDLDPFTAALLASEF